MHRVYLETIVRAPQARCFDLSRSIDFHLASMKETDEVAVAGRTSGLIENHEFVEWEGTHLWVRQRLASRITAMQRPVFFVDEMLSGAFHSFVHHHEMRSLSDGTTLMADDFRYQLPLGPLGLLAHVIFLKRYMERLIQTRATKLKAALEGEEWVKYLDSTKEEYH